MSPFAVRAFLFFEKKNLLRNCGVVVERRASVGSPWATRGGTPDRRPLGRARCPRAAHTPRRARAGPQDSSTNLRRVGRARQELARIPVLIDCYGRSVLTAAFSGRIAPYDPGSSDHVPKDFARDPSELEAGIPPDWSLKRLGDVAEIQTGLTLGKKRKSREKLVDVPYIRTQPSVASRLRSTCRYLGHYLTGQSTLHVNDRLSDPLNAVDHADLGHRSLFPLPPPRLERIVLKPLEQV